MASDTQNAVIRAIYDRADRLLRDNEDAGSATILQAYQDMQAQILSEINQVVMLQSQDGTLTLVGMQQTGRLTALLSSIQQAAQQLAAKVNTSIEGQLTTQYMQAYQFAAYGLDQATPDNVNVVYAPPPESAIKVLANSGYKGAMFSQRIGIITDEMSSDIRDELMQGMIGGESMADIGQRIEGVIGTEDQDDIVGRALRIARTETMRVQNIARNTTYDQNADIVEDSVREVTPDDRTCDECVALEGMTDDEIEASGESADLPVHPNCVLPGQMVLAPQLQAATKAFYSGVVIEISLADGSEITTTENHPILTPANGWVSAKGLQEGEYVLRSTDPQRMAQAINPYNNDRPALIEEVFGTLEMSSGVTPRSVKTTAEDFHGDAVSFKGDVDIVGAHGLLGCDLDAMILHILGEDLLRLRHWLGHLFSTLSRPAKAIPSLMTSSDGIVGSLGQTSPLSRGGGGHACKHCGRPIPGLDAQIKKPQANDLPTYLVSFRKSLFRCAGFVAPEKIIKIKRGYYSGHVYDLQSGIVPIYTCNGVIVHNCRCSSVPKLKSWSDLLGIDMPEDFDDDERGMRNENGDWVIAPVESFDEWLERRQLGAA